MTALIRNSFAGQAVAMALAGNLRRVDERGKGQAPATIVVDEASNAPPNRTREMERRRKQQLKARRKAAAEEYAAWERKWAWEGCRCWKVAPCSYCESRPIHPDEVT